MSEKKLNHKENDKRKQNHGRPANLKAELTDNDIPEKIVNRVAYEKYVEVKGHHLLNEGRMYKTSDVNVIVDLGAFRSKYFEKKIEHLPDDEKRIIYGQMAAVKGLIQKMGMLKQQAFGVARSVYIEDNSYLKPRQAELLEYFKKLHTVEEVHKIVNAEWGLPVPLAQIKNFRIKHFEQIQQLQEEYKRETDHVRLGYKRSRLEELSEMFASMKVTYEQRRHHESYKLMLMTMEQIRKEADIPELRMVFEGTMTNMNVDVQGVVQNHIEETIMMQRLNLKAIILSRMCAKTGVNPLIIMHRLMKSYYAKFTGTLPADQSIYTDDLIYPASHIYDFDKIEKLNKQQMQIEQDILEKHEKQVQDTENTPAFSDLKKLLAEKLEQKRTNLNKSMQTSSDNSSKK